MGESTAEKPPGFVHRKSELGSTRKRPKNLDRVSGAKGGFLSCQRVAVLIPVQITTWVCSAAQILWTVRMDPKLRLLRAKGATRRVYRGVTLAVDARGFVPEATVQQCGLHKGERCLEFSRNVQRFVAQFSVSPVAGINPHRTAAAWHGLASPPPCKLWRSDQRGRGAGAGAIRGAGRVSMLTAASLPACHMPPKTAKNGNAESGS